VWGRIDGAIRLDEGEPDGEVWGASGFILPMDIFFRNPHRLFFSRVGGRRLSLSCDGVPGIGVKDEDLDIGSPADGPDFSHIDWLNWGLAALTTAGREPVLSGVFGPRAAKRLEKEGSMDARVV